MPKFAHHRLEAYHAALDLADAGHRLARRIPHGYRWLADHLIRAACAVPVLTAEGANRASPGNKRQRFSEALGECGEAAAVAELVERLALVRGDEPGRGARARRPHRRPADRAGAEVRLSPTACRPRAGTPSSFTLTPTLTVTSAHTTTVNSHLDPITLRARLDPPALAPDTATAIRTGR